ncbi:MAG: glycosyltransferase [Mariprofundaceae bacterium]
MKHVVVVTSTFPHASKGNEASGAFAEEFVRELSQHVKVTVIAAGESDRIWKDNNLEVHYFAVPIFPISQLKVSRPSDWLYIYRSLQAGQKKLNGYLTENKVDHILALWAVPAGFWAMRTARKFNVPYSVWCLGSDILVLGRLPMVKQLIRKVLRGARNCFADGFGLAEEVMKLSGNHCSFLPTTRRLVAPVEKEMRSKGPYRLAYLGRWHPIKGTDILLDALTKADNSTFWSHIEQIKICGGGPLSDEVHSTCDALNVQEKPVKVLGYIDTDGVAELLNWADFLVLPSRSESIPVVFSECMQMKTPIIASPVGDLPKLINEYNVGVLMKDVSSEALLLAMQQALKSSPASFDKNIETAAKEFDVKKACFRFVEVLSSDA